MGITNGYITLLQLKGHIMANDGGTFSAEDDTNLETAIEATSRWLDDHFDSSFYARTETRKFTPDFSDLLWLDDDLLSITTLKTDDDGDDTYETTWTAATDYYLEPINAQLGSQPKPYRQIRVNSNGSNSFSPGIRHSAEVAGSWGYCTLANIPKELVQFVLLMSHRLWKRKDSVFGVAGAPQLGVTVIQARIQVDSDLMMLLEGVNERGW